MIKSPLHPTKNAYRWKQANGSSTWIVLGKTSAWSDDSHPPAEDSTQTAITQPFCAIKATIKWVIEDEDAGTITFTGNDSVTRLYRELTTYSALITARASDVLIIATTTGSQLASINGGVAPSLRQLGVCTDLVPASGHESDTFIAAANISSYGDLETLQNRVPLALPLTATSYTVQTMLQYGVS